MASNNNNNKQEERSKHIEVCVRLRPMMVQKESSGNSFFRHSTMKRKVPLPSRTSSPIKKTQQQQHETYAWDVIDHDTVTQSPHTDIISGRTHQYTLDKVYGPKTTTSELYRKSCLDLVQASMEGYHTAVLAYGQTSTGKTHTMTGTVQQPGLIPLSIKECFSYLDRQKTTKREYLIRVSYLEVYKEHIKDLLATQTTPIRLFETPQQGLQIKGLREEVVTSPEQVFSILAKGESRRQVGATSMNLHSSRSHVLVRLWIESRDLDPQSRMKTRVSSLSLVDLAGSESVRLTGSSERRQEGHYINTSLMTLGKVVYALSEGTKKHVPYRDSKLTRLLQPCLSGNAQMVLVCCISPLTSHLEESHNTFKFAIRAKKIPQKAVISELGDENKTLLQSYREEIQDLRNQLRELQSQQAKLLQQQPSSISELQEDADLEVQELVQAIGNMEKLILKTKPAQNLDDSLLSTHESIPVSPHRRNGDAVAEPPDLESELSRIQGLLSVVLSKRHSNQEVRELKLKLEQQEISSSLKSADSSFLQQQLVEKDNLLAEVSKLLETVEEKQSKLEAENKRLRRELERYRSR